MVSIILSSRRFLGRKYDTDRIFTISPGFPVGGNTFKKVAISRKKSAREIFLGVSEKYEFLIWLLAGWKFTSSNIIRLSRRGLLDDAKVTKKTVVG